MFGLIHDDDDDDDVASVVVVGPKYGRMHCGACHDFPSVSHQPQSPHCTGNHIEIIIRLLILL